jgi:hypothetical protein
MSEPTPPSTQSQERCRLLRSKSMFIEVEPDPTVPSMDSGNHWCVHTHNCLGPDGQVATPEACGSGRICFEEI